MKQYSEKLLERKLKARVEALGGLCLKFLSTINGYPDRICLLPAGVVLWVELKSTGKKPTQLQLQRHEELRSRGYRVYVVDDLKSLDNLPLC